MANSDRRYKDRNGNMFIPMNVEGGSWNEHFLTTPKLVALVGSVLSFIVMIAWLKGRYADFSAYLVFIPLYLFIFQYILRYIILEEKFYYKMYQNLKDSEITTPSIFWNITSIKETGDGALLTYSDGKVGLMVKLERDTITGKNEDFKEQHYDAISDFYKELSTRKLNFVQANIMEQAGNDPRLAELDKLTYQSDNTNICKIMELQVGYIKNITHRTLYESEYLLVYTKDLSKMYTIMEDTIESIYKILDGAFIGYKILDHRDIIDFIKEEYGIKYFDSTDATLTMFKNNGILTKKPFDLSEIVFNTGEVQKIGNKELNIINNWTSGIEKGTLDINKISIKDTLLSEDIKEEFIGIDFSTLSDVYEDTSIGNEQEEIKNKVKSRKFTINKKNDKIKDKKKVDKKKDKNNEVDKSGRHSVNTEDKTTNNSASINQQNYMDKEFSFEEVYEDDETIDF